MNYISRYLNSIQQQADVTAERQAKRAEAYVAPVESAEPTVEEKLKKKKRKERSGGEDDERSERKDKKKKKRKSIAEDDGSA